MYSNEKVSDLQIDFSATPGSLFQRLCKHEGEYSNEVSPENRDIIKQELLDAGLGFKDEIVKETDSCGKIKWTAVICVGQISKSQAVVRSNDLYYTREITPYYASKHAWNLDRTGIRPYQLRWKRGDVSDEEFRESSMRIFNNGIIARKKSEWDKNCTMDVSKYKNVIEQIYDDFEDKNRFHYMVELMTPAALKIWVSTIKSMAQEIDENQIVCGFNGI